MITHLPCGCKPKPLSSEKEIEDLILAGQLIWFAHSNELMSGFFKYHDKQVVSQFSLYDGKDTQILGAELTFEKAMQKIKDFIGLGCDFAHAKDSYLEFDRTGEATVICGIKQ